MAILGDTTGARAHIERAFSSLARLSWGRIDEVCDVTHEALATLGQPACLRYLFDRLLDDPVLMARSERQKQSDRVVIYEDPEDRFRVRLNRWRGVPETPHNHRFPFSARVLSGQYRHALYGDVEQFLERDSDRPLLPHLVRVERAGDCYSITEQMVHQTTAEPDTMSILVRGPAARDFGVALDPNTGRVASQKRGSATEAPTIHAATEMNRQQLTDVRDHLARLSLI